MVVHIVWAIMLYYGVWLFMGPGSSKCNLYNMHCLYWKSGYCLACKTLQSYATGPIASVVILVNAIQIPCMFKSNWYNIYMQVTRFLLGICYHYSA